MKKTDELKLAKYQKMNRAQDFLNSIEGGSSIDNGLVEVVRIKNALEFLRSLKNMNEFEVLASEKAINSAMNFLSKTETYVKECVVEAERKRELLSAQLQQARETAKSEFEMSIKPSFDNIIASLEKIKSMPLPLLHKADAFSNINNDISTMYKKITDLTGQTYSR